ncbi:DUF563 domain-containing protein [archaeon]|nr:MAG: DUF563 domain-containing protein [archaeon]
MPMEGACQDPVYNTWQILYMRDMVLKHIDSRPYHRVAAALSAVGRRKQNNVLDYHPYPYNTSVQINFNSNSQLKRKKVMLLLQRTSSSSFTRNSHDLVRQWNDIFTYSLLRALDQSYGGEYEVRVLSDQNLDYMNCFVCQAALLADTDVLIGMHGAGLGLMLYMPPNKAVIEIAPYANDGRCLLGAGPFSRLATLTSLNYMIHYPR